VTIERVLVVGAGLMGHGIAQTMAAAGRRVDVYEPEVARAVAGRERIAASLGRSVDKGRLEADERDAILARIAVTDDPAAAAAAADLVVEAVPEDEDLKRTVLASLDARAPRDAILVTNTSSISIDRLAEALEASRRPRFLGMHFFSPVPVMPLVEVVRGTATSVEAVADIERLAADLGKQTIASADRPGFIVNRVLMPLLVEAMRALEDGTGSAADIDAGARLGLNHPMGPLELADFIGLDVCLGILRVLEEGLGDRFAPPAVLLDHVDAGHLGRKTGRGFHAYER
jgi:3-hydroxybutyryl-CoA dehydrogenase